MSDVLTRNEARAKNLKRFFTGRECEAGHRAERYTSTGQCVPCLADRYAARREHYREISRRHYYGTTYGITPEQADQLRASASTCPGCLTPFTEKTSHIDHCHTTGAIRGVLCGPCNQVLGLVREDCDTLARLSEYLRAGA